MKESDVFGIIEGWNINYNITILQFAYATI
jgi:hypothetical protein